MTGWTPSFDDFWMLYPRRVAKKAAERMWRRLTPPAKRTAMLALPAHIRYWSQKCEDCTTIPHPATWINGERWNDDLGLKKPELPARTQTVQVVTGCFEPPKPPSEFARSKIATMKKLVGAR